MSVGVFGYGSLASGSSVGKTIGRPVEPARAELSGWRRRWSLLRDNLGSEKTFALADGALPPFILGLNIEPGEDPAGPVNGAMFELTDQELQRLDVREMRYDRIDVSDAILLPDGADRPPTIVTYRAKPDHYAAEPPPGAIILAKYAGVVEHAFELLGPGERERFLATTGAHPVEVVEATLVKDEIPPGNPRAW
ncbi:MAG: gamma-glutamylcyclotransferase family protein [Solirubrobacterales bacterium]